MICPVCGARKVSLLDEAIVLTLVSKMSPLPALENTRCLDLSKKERKVKEYRWD